MMQHRISLREALNDPALLGHALPGDRALERDAAAANAEYLAEFRRDLEEFAAGTVKEPVE
jgi:hypothetical protein